MTFRKLHYSLDEAFLLQLSDPVLGTIFGHITLVVFVKHESNELAVNNGLRVLMLIADDYPLLMPLWVHIATTGSQGMKERLAALEREHGTLDIQTISPTETIFPKRGDYFLSIFFITFGVVSCVAGLLSNFIVHII